MKKLVLFFAVIVAVAVAVASCGNKSENTETTVDSTSVGVEVIDTVVTVDSIVAPQ